MSITLGIRGSTLLAEEWKTTLQRKVGKILVEMGALEAYLLCPTDVTGIVGMLAKNACDRGTEGFVFVKTTGANLVARRKAECGWTCIARIPKRSSRKEKTNIDERRHSFRKSWL